MLTHNKAKPGRLGVKHSHSQPFISCPDSFSKRRILTNLAKILRPWQRLQITVSTRGIIILEQVAPEIFCEDMQSAAQSFTRKVVCKDIA